MEGPCPAWRLLKKVFSKSPVIICLQSSKAFLQVPSMDKENQFQWSERARSGGCSVLFLKVEKEPGAPESKVVGCSPLNIEHSRDTSVI